MITSSETLQHFKFTVVIFLIDWTPDAERSPSIFPLSSGERHPSDWFPGTTRLINRRSILIRSRGWEPWKTPWSCVVPKPEPRDPPRVSAEASGGPAGTPGFINRKSDILKITETVFITKCQICSPLCSDCSDVSDRHDEGVTQTGHRKQTAGGRKTEELIWLRLHPTESPVLCKTTDKFKLMVSYLGQFGSGERHGLASNTYFGWNRDDWKRLQLSLKQQPETAGCGSALTWNISSCGHHGNSWKCPELYLKHTVLSPCDRLDVVRLPVEK